MAVGVDATCAAVTTGGATTNVSSTNLTVTASATALLVFFSGSAPGITGVTCTWDNGASNQACTSLALMQNGVDAYIQLFGLLSPVAGAKTLRIAWTGSASVAMFSISLTGTATSSIANAFTGAQQTSGSTQTFTITVPSATGNMAFSAFGDNQAQPTSLTATGSTQLFVDSANLGWIASRAPGATSVAFSANAGTAAQWVATGISANVEAVQQGSAQADGAGAATGTARQFMIATTLKG